MNRTLRLMLAVGLRMLPLAACSSGRPAPVAPETLVAQVAALDPDDAFELIWQQTGIGR